MVKRVSERSHRTSEVREESDAQEHSELRETTESTEERLRRVLEPGEVHERSEETVSQRMKRALGSLEEPERPSRSTEDRLRKVMDELEEKSEARDAIESHYEIRLREEFDETLENFPEMELRKDFGEKYGDVERYYERIENGENPTKPELVCEIELLELQRQFEASNGGPPDVQIDSMRDFDELKEKYSGQVEVSEKDYKEVQTYFDIRNERGKSQHQLAEEYGYSQSKISNIRRGVETGVTKELRGKEEERIIQEWIDSQEFDLRQSDTSRRELSIDESRPYRVKEQVLKEAFQEVQESKEINRIILEDAVEKIVVSSSDQECRMRISDLSGSGLNPEELAKMKSVLEEYRIKIQDTIEQRIGLEKVRIGVVNDRLYIWTPDMTPNDMVNAWYNQYFYMSSHDMSEISDRTGRQLDLGGSRRERLKNLDDLMNQMVDVESLSCKIKIDGARSRLLGEALHIQRDVLGIKNKDLEGRVSKITGINGHGGISNPKFPEGQKLETWRAGLIGSVLSDGHVRSDDSIVEYYEENLERLNRFRESLKEIGDFTNEPSFNPRSNIYRLKLPSPYGKALNYWGVPSGDKAIENPGLPSDFRRWSPEAKRNYGSEMESEESCVTSGRCVWPRHNAIKIGAKKSDNYESRECISKKEVDLIRDKGVTRSGDFEGQKIILYSSLKDLKEDSNPEIAKTAHKLENTIHNNRNNMMDNERELYSDLGIDVTVTPRLVSLYKSGRVSVKWEARTSDSSATIRLGIMCPPNHPEKEVALKKWINTRKPEKVQSILADIENDGFTIPDGWKPIEIEETGG